MTTPKERLDPFFTSLGFKPGKNEISGLAYTGSYRGRAVRVVCSVRRRTRYAGEIRYTRYAGHRLVFDVETPLKTRLVLFPPDRALVRTFANTNRLFGSQKLTDLPAAWAHLEGWAAETAWASSFIARPAVQEAVVALIPMENRPPSIGLTLRPGHFDFSVQLDINEVTPDTAARWFNALLSLVEEAEASSPPTKTVELSWIERTAQSSPVLLAFIIIFACIALSIIPALCLVILSIMMAGGL